MSGTGRRDFVALFGGTAAAWPLAARAQQAARCRPSGFWARPRLRPPVHGPPLSCSDCANSAGSRAATVAIEYRWAEGRSERFAEIAAEFVRLKVDVIVTRGSPQSLAAKQATSVIPIVFATAGDPVGTGLVASLARPGGNVTGLSIQATDLAGKRARAFARGCSPVSGGWRSWPMSAIPPPWLEMGEVQAAARTLGLEVDHT